MFIEQILTSQARRNLYIFGCFHQSNQLLTIRGALSTLSEVYANCIASRKMLNEQTVPGARTFPKEISKVFYLPLYQEEQTHAFVR